jgi:hypothetical protein
MPAVKTTRKAGSATTKKTSKIAAKASQKVTLDDVWATIRELQELHKETEKAHRETEKAIERMSARVDLTTENVNRMADKVDRVSDNVGGLNLSMGGLIETLFAPHLGEKFDSYHYNLKRSFNRVPIYDDSNRMRTDIDILLSNTTVCMAVEVKRWLEKIEHVDDHIKRMQLIRQYPPAEVKGKKLLGAIVGAVVTPEAREYAEKNGFFVLELKGEDVYLHTPPKDFQPKEW